VSRFDDLLKTAKRRPSVPQEPPSPAPVDTPAPRGPGRPKGKRSNPAFVQVSAHIPGELHHNVKLALLRERKGVEFSELVAELLSGWLAKRPGA
jgi:hypothetical protein